MENVRKSDIIEAFKTLNISGKKILTHCSLKSFGKIEGGVQEVIDAFIESFDTILMAGFTYNAKERPPNDIWPKQNGCVYSKLYPDDSYSDLPFLIENSNVHQRLGIVSQTFSLRDDVYRSDHPMHSWIAWGKDASALLDNHLWEKPYLPLERLAKLDGYVALIGVDLFPCTAIHVAEERSGRRPFIRWGRDRNGQVKVVRTGGCANWFNNLLPYCEDVFQNITVGSCLIRAAHLGSLIDHFVSLVQQHPDLTVCSEKCLRCTDAVKGGPIDENGV